MVSREGFETWLDYEILFVAVFLAAFGLAFVGYVLYAWVDQWVDPLSLPTDNLVVPLIAVCIVALAVFVWLAGRLD
jgi:dolichol kinase